LRRSSREFDAANPDSDFLDPINDCMQGAARLFCTTQEIYPSGKLLLAEHGLQRLGNPLRKIACNWQQLVEQRNAALQGGEQQFESYACTRRGIRIDNAAEQPGIAQALHRLFEVTVGGVLSDLQAARGKNFFVGVARSSRGFQRDEFEGAG